MKHRALILAVITSGALVLVTGCSATAPPTAPTRAASTSSAFPDEPANVGDAKIAATKYYNDGDYATDLAKVGARASGWIVTEAPKVKKPAVVFDIDETALSNWPAIVADNFGRVNSGPCDALPSGPCGWNAWSQLAEAKPIASTLKVFDVAKKAGAAVFFITGRDESMRAATVKNLQSAGYLGYTQLLMEPVGSHFASATDFKAPERAAVEARGFTIIANIGDQPSDLAGGHSIKTFLLPDPFYRIP